MFRVNFSIISRTKLLQEIICHCQLN